MDKEITDIVYAAIETLRDLQDEIDQQCHRALGDCYSLEECNQKYTDEFKNLNNLADELEIAADNIKDAIDALERAKYFISNL